MIGPFDLDLRDHGGLNLGKTTNCWSESLDSLVYHDFTNHRNHFHPLLLVVAGDMDFLLEADHAANNLSEVDFQSNGLKQLDSITFF